jgi:hypothetical protein
MKMEAVCSFRAAEQRTRQCHNLVQHNMKAVSVFTHCHNTYVNSFRMLPLRSTCSIANILTHQIILTMFSHGLTSKYLGQFLQQCVTPANLAIAIAISKDHST